MSETEEIFVDRLSDFELVEFARYGELAIFNELVHLGLTSKINEAVDSHGNGLLHMAAANGHLELVDLLLKQSPDSLFLLKKSNQEGNTALHWACVAGQAKVVPLLLEKHADDLLSIENKAGRTAICEAEGHGHQKILSIFETVLGDCAQPVDTTEMTEEGDVEEF